MSVLNLDAAHAPGVHFAPASLSDIVTLPAWLASLSSPIDSFLEDHIRHSAFHRIVVGGRDAGHFAVHRGVLLTQFHLIDQARRLGSHVLNEIKTSTRVTSAFVPTCDEFFLSHVLEDESARLTRQACFFVEATPFVPLPPITSGVNYRAARSEDAEPVSAMCGDFLDHYAERIAKRELHIGHLNGKLVALGVIERSTLFPKQASIGMFTHEAHRGHGVGKSTIIYMRSVCHAEGARPVAGCWYYNHASRKTLEAAGMTTVTRLLRFEFGATP
jgi:GNAT superfamily N-acetyltransferase